MVYYLDMEANKKQRGPKMKNEGKQIADTILNQLGGGRFVAMTNAKNLCHDDDGTLRFKIGRNNTRCNFVKITLDASDTYTMEFYYSSVKGLKELQKTSGLYHDALQGCFTRFTGLQTSL